VNQVTITPQREGEMLIDWGGGVTYLLGDVNPAYALISRGLALAADEDAVSETCGCSLNESGQGHFSGCPFWEPSDAELDALHREIAVAEIQRRGMTMYTPDLQARVAEVAKFARREMFRRGVKHGRGMSK
jgi:hypothetical protein